MNGLDLMATLDLRRIITSGAAKGTTFIVSSHILSELEKISDDIILINGGQLVFQTTMAELRGLGEQNYELMTDDNSRALKVLLNEGFKASLQGEWLRVDNSEDQLTAFVETLLANHFKLLDITHQGMDLETATLHYIHDAKGVGRHD
jgi:ABC-2 type transport system ATP-binding protein